MKGTITKCLGDWVTAKYGKERWRDILTQANAGEKSMSITMAVADVDDKLAVALFAATGKVLGLDENQVADGFGEYWCCSYAPALYGAIIKRFHSAREMILGMDHVHVQMTRTIEQARPPRFDYRWETEKILFVTYKSQRNLVHLYIGLARGVGKYFNEHLTVSRVGPQLVRIEFA
jgi:hypothetical protein